MRPAPASAKTSSKRLSGTPRPTSTETSPPRMPLSVSAKATKTIRSHNHLHIGCPGFAALFDTPFVRRCETLSVTYDFRFLHRGCRRLLPSRHRPQNQSPPSPVSLRHLRRRLCRPHQYWLRRPHYEQGPSDCQPAVRLPQRHLLLRILLIRNPQQLPAAQNRRARLDRTHSAHLGTHRHPDGLRRKRPPTLRNAVFAWPRRSRILPRNRSLPHLLVPSARYGTNRSAVHDRPPGDKHRRRSDLRRDPRSCSLAESQ